MALIRRADAQQLAQDAVSLDLGHLEKIGEAMIAHAQAEAHRILAEAQIERDRLITTATAEGHQKGQAAGFAIGKEQGIEAGRAEAIADISEKLDALTEAWAEALLHFIERRERMLLDARQDVVKLACEIAARATGRIIEMDPTLACDQLAEILTLVAARTRLRIRICRDDESMLHDALPGILASLQCDAHVELVADPAVHRGSCLAVTERNGVLDASIETKLSRLISSILPREEGQQ